eukprot:11194786-Lingulodinium_polyedra.AAC.1
MARAAAQRRHQAHADQVRRAGAAGRHREAPEGAAGEPGHRRGEGRGSQHPGLAGVPWPRDAARPRRPHRA